MSNDKTTPVPVSVDEIKKQIAEILRANIHYSPQLENYVVHGAIENIFKLMQEYAISETYDALEEYKKIAAQLQSAPVSAEEYFENCKVTFSSGMSSGDYLDKEDFFKYAAHSAPKQQSAGVWAKLKEELLDKVGHIDYKELSHDSVLDTISEVVDKYEGQQLHSQQQEELKQSTEQEEFNQDFVDVIKDSVRREYAAQSAQQHHYTPDNIDDTIDFDGTGSKVDKADVAASLNLQSQQQEDKALREIAHHAWTSAANAYRQYPDQKHTFSDYWKWQKQVEQQGVTVCKEHRWGTVYYSDTTTGKEQDGVFCLDCGMLKMEEETNIKTVEEYTSQSQQQDIVMPLGNPCGEILSGHDQMPHAPATNKVEVEQQENKVEKYTKEQAYELATLREIGTNATGTRQDIIYRAMDIYAEQFKCVPELKNQIEDYKHILLNFTDCPLSVINNPGLLRGKLPTDNDIAWANKEIKKFKVISAKVKDHVLVADVEIEEDNEEIEKKIAEILRTEIHYSPQVETYVIHGAVESLKKLLQKGYSEDKKTLSIREVEGHKINDSKDKIVWTDELIVMYAEAHRFSTGRISLKQFKEMIGTDWDKPLRKTAKELIKEWEENSKEQEEFNQDCVRPEYAAQSQQQEDYCTCLNSVPLAISETEYECFNCGKLFKPQQIEQQEDKLEKLSKDHARLHFHPDHSKDAYTACVISFKNGYKACLQLGSEDKIGKAIEAIDEQINYSKSMDLIGEKTDAIKQLSELKTFLQSL